MLLALAGGLLLGMEVAWEGLLPQILSPIYGLQATGWMGFASMAADIVGSAIGAVLVDRFFRRRMVAFLLVVTALMLFPFAWFAMSLPGPSWFFWERPLFPTGIIPVTVSLILLGALQGAPYGVAYELGAELSFPLSEGISAALLSVSSAVFSILCLVLWPLLPIEWINLLSLVQALAAILVAAFILDRYPRADLEASTRKSAPQ
jgi:MFS family permease